MRLSERLFDRLTEMGLDPDSLPKRIRTGYWQRAQGAWRWSCYTKTKLEIGSQDTMLECVMAKRLEVERHNHDIIVYAYPESAGANDR